MVWKILQVMLLIGAVVFLAYLGISIWSSCSGPGTGPDMPSLKKATHEFYIENTGGLILASDYEQQGQMKGARLFILHGYWEMRGKKFKFVNEDVKLDEAIFGKITVKRRG